MAVLIRAFTWGGKYYLDFKELPDDGLSALYHELALLSAKSGISFSADLNILLADVAREISNRKD